jgi:predicted RNA-binding protein (virulence factor B family)
MQPELGKTLTLKVKNKLNTDWVIQAGNQVVLLPEEEAPHGLQIGDFISVILYLNTKGELVTSAQPAIAEVGQNASLRVVASSETGAFLDWGLPKDLFLPRTKQKRMPEVGEYVFVRVFFDTFSNRLAASALEEDLFSNENHQLKEMQLVKLKLFKSTPMGYLMIVNNQHIGMLYNNEVFATVQPNVELDGYVKKVKDNNLIDVVLGKPGYQKVGDQTQQIIQLLKEANGFLPFHDKSDPEEIYRVFGMSKKNFKMCLGNLFREKKIQILSDGIELLGKTKRP